ncbi:hypothetical protein [Telluribacter humicola]|uniref:hypothetical protein n=1 Tax=Telluribacter humicola TaxID=1720261 RepID=UPI001A95D00E|nr:hypothetical protein [Telluribacter humicola]
MNTEENYLHKTWSDSIESISIDDVREAISEVQEIEGEHVAFWVGIFDEDEFILEADKDLNLTGVFGTELDEQIKFKAKSWEEVEELFTLFLDGEIEDVRTRLKTY